VAKILPSGKSSGSDQRECYVFIPRTGSLATGGRKSYYDLFAVLRATVTTGIANFLLEAELSGAVLAAQ